MAIGSKKRTWWKAAEIVYPFMIKYYLEHGRSPSLRDICAGAGLTTTSMASFYLDMLEVEGWVKRDDKGFIEIPGFKIEPGREIKQRLQQANVVLSEVIQ